MALAIFFEINRCHLQGNWHWVQQRKLGVCGLVQELGAMEDGARSRMPLKKFENSGKINPNEKANLNCRIFWSLLNAGISGCCKQSNIAHNKVAGFAVWSSIGGFK